MHWKPLLIALAVTAALPAAAEEPPAVGVGSIPTVTAVGQVPESADARRERLLREIELAELELKLAKLRGERALLDPAARPVVAAVPVPAPAAPVVSAPAPAATPAPAPAPVAAAVVSPPPAPARPARRAASSEPHRDRAGATVGYIAVAGALHELRTAGGARLRAVGVDPRRPLLRPGPGVIADPVGAAVAMTDGAGAPASGSVRMRRVLGGGGDADMGGLGLPPPLPGLPATGDRP